VTSDAGKTPAAKDARAPVTPDAGKTPAAKDARAPVTPDAGKTPAAAAAARRAPFELLAFTAAPVAGALIVVELEGRFTGAQAGRFGRQPVLVVERGDDRPRLELAPVRATLDDGRWRSAYAIPAEAFPGARFALGLRGTLLELPTPDEPDDTDRLTALAREANTLRRALEAAEAEAAATSADLGAAISAARDEATDRITTLETDLAEAAATRDESVTRITTLEADLAEAERTAVEQTAAHEQALADAERGAAERTAAHEQAVADATARADDAEQRATEADTRARVTQDDAAAAAAARAADAESRADAAQEAARVATSGTDVLRAELAEERERSRAVVAELEAELEAARRRADAVRNAARAETHERGASPLDPTEPLAGALPLDPAEPFVGASPLDPTETGADDITSIRQPATLSGRRARVVGPAAARASTHTTPPRGVGPWIAVGALVLFAFVLLGLLLGFLA
jgi:chemotaxis protein histidine kinase CheA